MLRVHVRISEKRLHAADKLFIVSVSGNRFCPERSDCSSASCDTRNSYFPSRRKSGFQFFPESGCFLPNFINAFIRFGRIRTDFYKKFK